MIDARIRVSHRGVGVHKLCLVLDHARGTEEEEHGDEATRLEEADNALGRAVLDKAHLGGRRHKEGVSAEEVVDRRHVSRNAAVDDRGRKNHHECKLLHQQQGAHPGEAHYRLPLREYRDVEVEQDLDDVEGASLRKIICIPGLIFHPAEHRR